MATADSQQIALLKAGFNALLLDAAAEAAGERMDDESLQAYLSRCRRLLDQRHTPSIYTRPELAQESLEDVWERFERKAKWKQTLTRVDPNSELLK